MEAAEHLMADKQVRRLSVVHGDNRPAGMLSMNDIARHVATARTGDGVARTLAATCQPRTRTLEVEHAATATA